MNTSQTQQRVAVSLRDYGLSPDQRRIIRLAASGSYKAPEGRAGDSERRRAVRLAADGYLKSVPNLKGQYSLAPLGQRVWAELKQRQENSARLALSLNRYN